MAAIADTDNKIAVNRQMTPALHVCTHVVAHPLQREFEIFFFFILFFFLNEKCKKHLKQTI